MPALIPYTTIAKDTSSNDDLDFNFLRKKGIEYIESLGSEFWTDYNSHDPGITILEVLSYAITDLGSRMALPMSTLLAEQGNPDYLKEQFLTAERALPIKPITAVDYRKLFIDITGIKNAWIRKHIKKVHVDCKNHKLAYKPFPIPYKYKKDFIYNGLYDILIEPDELDKEIFNTEAKQKKELKRLITEVRTAYHSHRNLCEDLINIDEVGEYPVAVCAQIELLPEADEEKVHALILQTIEDYLSPILYFYSLKQMLKKGYTSDEIYNGPFLENGFIDDDELSNTELKTEIRLSDIIERIMKIEGVDVIRDITVNDCNDIGDGSTEWILCVPKNKKPKYAIKVLSVIIKDSCP